MASPEKKPKVMLLGTIEHATAAWEQVEAAAEVCIPKSTRREDFIVECRSGALDGVVAIYRTFDSLSITGRMDAELLSALPNSVKFICHNGAGYDQIDVKACTSCSIYVSNTPTAVDDSTADIGIFLMLGALRNIQPAITAVRAGQWRGTPLPRLGHDPQGKVLGFLGMGGIGRNMAKKALAFGMKIRYYNRTRLSSEQEAECQAEYVDFDTLLKESDVLSLNLPLNPATRHIISAREFAKMKPGIVIVNTARGAIMNESHLIDALASGQVSTVGLDVYETEPKVHPALIANPSVLIVPHMGTWTVETETKMEEWTISNVLSALHEGRLRSVVPEQKGLTFPSYAKIGGRWNQADGARDFTTVTGVGVGDRRRRVPLVAGMARNVTVDHDDNDDNGENSLAIDVDTDDVSHDTLSSLVPRDEFLERIPEEENIAHTTAATAAATAGDSTGDSGYSADAESESSSSVQALDKRIRRMSKRNTLRE